DSTQHTYGGSYTNSTWLWDFADPADNTADTTQSPCHIYTQPGFYPVTLIIEPYGRCSDTITKTVEVRPKPTASFSYAQTDSCAVATYCFTDLSTPTGNVPISAWQWCYSGGNCESTSTGTTCHSFAAEITYPVTLTITDNEGCSNETTMNIAVNAINHIEAIPVFSVVDSCNISIVCATDASMSERPVTNRTWTFAGVQSTAASPCFTSPTGGSYPLTLRVADATGCYSQDTIMVTTNPHEPDAAFTYDVINYTVNFTNQSTSAGSLQWFFGDGISSTNIDPTHTYTGPGTYTVSLLAGSGGCYDTASATIVLDTLPVNTAYDTVCGIVYMDEFGNGTYNVGTDMPQSGATVSAGSYTTTTNPVGYYQLALPAGTHILQLQNIQGTNFVQPVDGYYQFTLPGFNQKLCNYNFGVERIEDGVAGAVNNFKITVVPNPFNEYTTLTLTGVNGEFDLTVSNAIGEVVAAKNIRANQPLRLDRNQLTAGLYIYSITGRNNMVARGKLVVE
ncbi:MAG TPA: PKD domain-containing protein, partial [Chitinophagales bacterium]|nr:PKD domain-containing protein [Chitinophagales bacterium]